VTTYKDPLIQETLKSIISQKIIEKEILVAAPDKETQDIVREFAKKTKTNIKIIADAGKGKPAALNLCFNEAKGDTLVLTDGDVILDENAIIELLKPFSDPKVGVVSGRPISVNSRNKFFGYISHLLTDVGAHQTRLNKKEKNKFMVCSGYLMALRKNIVKKIPENSLADDAVMSHLVYEAGYKTDYAPNAKVYVKYPTNLKDWIKQKRRSTAGYPQLDYLIKGKERMRDFKQESLGIFKIFFYPRNFKEFIWTCALIFLRLYLWLIVFYEIRIKKSGMELWQRVESTK
jgi:cellulose synthase/poly-beta-1,6-N-acetylglucosamine synthase-like glycosyltransferase